MKWTPERSALAHAAKARRRIERAERGEDEPQLVRVPRGEYLGTLEWHAADGRVRRWVIRQGARANNITVRSLIAGASNRLLPRTWTWLLDGLRRVLSVPRRVSR